MGEGKERPFSWEGMLKRCNMMAIDEEACTCACYSPYSGSIQTHADNSELIDARCLSGCDNLLP